MMSAPEALGSLARLDPSKGATTYETTPLAGEKRRHIDDDVDEDNTPLEYDSTLEDDPAYEDMQTQPLTGKDKLGQITDTLDGDDDDDGTNVSDADEQESVRKTKRAKVKVNIEKKKTRNIGNGLEVEYGSDIWYPAIYHTEYVEIMDRLHPSKPKYKHARKAGPLGKGDKTAYLEEQKNWGKGRSDRPAILFEFKKPENAYPASDPPALSIFIDGIRKIVIDVINNRPLRTFPHLPITISSTVEGWLQEAWFRQDPAVRAEDLIQRMAYTAEHNVYENRNVINKLVRRREVFRNEGRCLSWTKGVWTKECDRYLIREMQETHDPANPNSTRHLKDLTPDDKAAFRDKTYMTGNYFSKSGNRELTGKRREEKDRAVADREAKRSAEVARKVSDLNTGHELGEDQAQIKTRGSEATDSQTLHDTASVQLREQARPVPMAPSASSMSHPNMLSVSGPETPRNLNREKVHDGLSGRGDDHNAASADLQTTEQPDASLMNTLTDGYPVHLEPPFLPIDQQHYVQPQSQRLSNHATPLDLVGHPQQFQQSHGQREQYTFGDDLSEVGRHSHPGPIRSAGPQPLYPRAPISSFGMGPPLHTPYMYNIGESRPYFYPTDPYMSQSNVFDEYQSPFFPGGYYPNFDLNSNIFMQDRLIRDVPAHLQSHPGQVSTAPFFPQQPQQPQQHQHVYGAIHGDVNGDIWTAGQSSAHDNESFAPVPYAHPFEPASSRRYEMMAGGNQQRAEDDDAQGHITVGTSRATSRKRGAAVEPDSDLAGPSRKFRKLD